MAHAARGTSPACTHSRDGDPRRVLCRENNPWIPCRPRRPPRHPSTVVVSLTYINANPVSIVTRGADPLASGGRGSRALGGGHLVSCRVAGQTKRCIRNRLDK